MKDDKARQLRASWSFTSRASLMEEMIGTDLVPDPDYEALSDEEKVWDRLKYGVRAKTVTELIEAQLAEEIRAEIDKEIIAAMSVSSSMLGKRTK